MTLYVCFAWQRGRHATVRSRCGECRQSARCHGFGRSEAVSCGARQRVMNSGLVYLCVATGRACRSKRSRLRDHTLCKRVRGFHLAIVSSLLALQLLVAFGPQLLLGCPFPFIPRQKTNNSLPEPTSESWPAELYRVAPQVPGTHLESLAKVSLAATFPSALLPFASPFSSVTPSQLRPLCRCMQGHLRQ